MEFGQLMTAILVNVSCKFEMYIFKIVQVINENARIAFLYVLSVFFDLVFCLYLRYVLFRCKHIVGGIVFHKHIF